MGRNFSTSWRRPPDICGAAESRFEYGEHRSLHTMITFKGGTNVKKALALSAILVLLVVLWVSPAGTQIARHGDGEILGGPMARHGDGEILGAG